MGMVRNQFTFYRSYYESLVELPEEEQAQTLLAVIRYAIYGSLPQKLPVSGKVAFNLIKPTLDSARKKAAAGKAGGASESAASPNGKSKSKSASPNGKSKSEVCFGDRAKLERGGEREREGEREGGIGECAASGQSRADFFEALRRAYPEHRRGNSDEAWAAFESFVPDGQEQAALDALDKWKKSEQWTDDGGRFVPGLSKWLVQGLWKCPPETELPSGNGQQMAYDPDQMAAIRRMLQEDDPKGGG